MKKKILSVFLVGAMAASMLVGCGGKTTADNQEASAETEVAETTEETSEITESEAPETVESEANVEDETATDSEETEVATETEDTAAETEGPAEETYETFDYVNLNGDTVSLIRGSENDPYVKRLHDAGIGVGKYDKAVIIYDEKTSKTYICNPCKNNKAEKFFDVGYETCDLSEDELKDYYNTFEEANSAIYNKFKNGEIEKIDADGDGIFTYADLTLISLFETDLFEFVGCIEIENTGKEI